LSDFGLGDKSRTVVYEDLPLAEYEPVVSVEVTVVRFLRGTLLWFDITASITAGTSPRLLPHHSSVLNSNSQIQLEYIMGCKNWVMAQIGRISALHERKTRTSRHKHWDFADPDNTVAELNMDIHRVLSEGMKGGLNHPEDDPAPVSNKVLDPSALTTRIFASMGFIYLHLITQGFQNLDVLDTTIAETMRILQTTVSTQLLPALVCPLFVIGCAVDQGDQQFFRDTFSSPPLLDPLLQHRRSILPVLEDIWSRRQSAPGFTWQESLELTNDIMLL